MDLSISQPRAVLVWQLAVGVLATPMATAAQEPPASPRPAPTRRAAHRIVLDVLTGAVQVRTPNGTVTQSWSAAERATGRAPLAAIPVSSPVDVEIVNANPLLYRYDVQTAVVARRPLPTCGTLGTRLASSSFLTGFATVATIAQPTLSQTMGQLFQAPANTGEPATRGSALLSATALAASLTEHRPAIDRYLQFLATVRSLSASLDDSLAIIAELAEVQPADSLLAGLMRSLDHAYPGLGQSARVPLTIREQHEAAWPHLAALTGVTRSIERGDIEGDATNGPAAEIVRLTSTVRQAQDSLAPAYRALQAQLARIETARSRTRQVFNTDAGADVRRLTLEAQPTQEFPAVFRSRAGRQELYVEPTLSVLCQVSIGVAFMDRPPTFTVVNGLIAREDNDSRTGVSVMLHLATARVPVVGGLVGFGFGQDAGPDLFAGGSVRAFDPIMLNAGVVWQRAQRLPAGFVEGTTPPDAARMSNLPRGYRSAFFWGLSIAR